jgi:dihydropteroate synthase
VVASELFPADRVTILGVLNATPDSFSDGGRLLGEDRRPRLDAALALAESMLRAGAHVLDLGGESTRPGARAVSAAEEIRRTRPIVEALAKHFEAPISIDTRKAAVAEAALGAGATIVNDVSGLRCEPELAGVAARAGAALVLGHLRGEPETMQRAPHFDDVLSEVAGELAESVARARAAGIPAERLAVDPGLGFGKRLPDNLALLAQVGWLRERLGLPVLVGPSRKSFLGELTGDPVGERDAATWAACAVAAFAGADALRVHEVAGAVRAAAVGRALARARRGERP